MSRHERMIRKQIQMGYWPGFIVGMYPSHFAYNTLESVDFKKAWHDVKEINLYYHIPFCKWKCAFCTFPAVVKDDSEYYDQYVNKLNEQINFYGEQFDKPVVVKSICFGGGTPNILDVEHYQKIFNTLKNNPNFIFDENLEPSMEVSPEILTKDFIDGIVDVGVKRLSMGVQSFNEGLRQKINREKTLSLGDIFHYIRNKGVSINLDVINGLIGQTTELFMETLREIVLEYGPETISIYPLSGKGNSMFKKTSALMTTKEKYDTFREFYDFLVNNGYECESHVKFIRQDTTSTHQQKIYEYKGTETLGVGYAARSYNEKVHYGTESSHRACDAMTGIDHYIKESFEDQKWVGFYMNEDENKRRTIIYGFFLGEISDDVYKEKYGSSMFDDFSEEFDALLKNDLVTIEDGVVKSTKEGRVYTDIIGVLFWSPHINDLYRGKKVA